MRQTIVVTALLVGFSRQAHGQTAAEMQSYCKPIAEGDRGSSGDKRTVNFPSTFETGMCWGAFAAVQGAFTIYETSKKNGHAGVLGPCLPPKASRADIVRVFSAYLDKHLDRQGDDFFVVVYDALRETYPHICKRGFVNE